MYGLFTGSPARLAQVIFATVFLSIFSSLAQPTPAYAQLLDVCAAINGGALNKTVQVGGGQEFASLQGATAGQTVIVTFNNVGGIVADVDFVQQFFDPGPTGVRTFVLPVGANVTVEVHADRTGTPGSFSATCGGAQPPQPPVTPPLPVITDLFIPLDQQAAMASLDGDRASVDPLNDVLLAKTISESNSCEDLERRRALVASQIVDVDLKLVQDEAAMSRTGNPMWEFLDALYRRDKDTDLKSRLTSELNDLDEQLRACGKVVPFGYAPSSSAIVPAPLQAFDALLAGGGTPQDHLSFLAPLGYASGGLLTDAEAGALGDWRFWVRGNVSGLSATGASAFNAISGRIDLGGSRALPAGIIVGGLIGWDGSGVNDPATGGTVRSNAIHFGVFGSYRLPNDIVLAISGGAAFGGLTSTIGADSGSTGTQRGFLSASLSGNVWSNGPWRLDASGNVFIGAEHQNAFTTNGGTAVPAQTITLGSATANARLGYALPTEIPMELFGTASLGANGGNTAAAGLSGSIGAGLSVTRGAMQASFGGSIGAAGATRSWSLTATVGGHF